MHHQLLLLLLLFATAADVDGRILQRDQQETDLTERTICPVGPRQDVQTALDELFTCQVTNRLKYTRLYQLASSIDFGRIAGSGVTQPPLLTPVYSMAEVAAESSSYRQFFDVLDAFTIELGQNETRGPKELELLENYKIFLENSPYIIELYATLRSNGQLQSAGSVREFVRTVLDDQWFKLYGRSSKGHASGLRESSGFGHVMVGELRGSSVTGFHSWLQILATEAAGNFDYKGHFQVKKGPLVVASIQFDWMGRSKSLSSFIFGVPPDFEIALVSASFVVNPGRKTIFRIAGEELALQTFRVNHQLESIGTAYAVL